MIGHPVRHSLSPTLFNAAFKVCGLDWAYLALDVAPGDGEAAVRSVGTLGLVGLSVTMPHKEAAARACDRLTTSAAALGAVNCVVPAGDGLLGDSTDGPGFVAALRKSGHDPTSRRCVVVGAGGAARAIVHALGAAGASEVAVVARRPLAASIAATLAGPVGIVGDASIVGEADIVCNATSVGMSGTDAAGLLPFDAGLLQPGQIVVDIVYHPMETPLLAAARAAGAVPVSGIGMLVHQAALAFERWTQVPAPVTAMMEAVSDAIGPDAAPSA